jgi:hypothetical protein
MLFEKLYDIFLRFLVETFWKYFQNHKSCWRLLAAIGSYWAAIGWLLAAIGRLLPGYWRLLGGYWLPPEKLIASQ